MPWPFSHKDKPGKYKGQHFSTYVDEIDELKRAGNDEELERLLFALVDATEADSRANNWGVAPAYYEELAIMYRKRKDYASEVKILERYAGQQKASGAGAGKLAQRLSGRGNLQRSSPPPRSADRSGI